MLWLALEFPHLALDALGDTEAAAPLAICEQDGSRRRVVDCNAAAHGCGVRAGMALGAAQALCAALRVLPRRPRDEHAALIRRATWALRFSPTVGVRGEDRVLLEIAASCRLFGGLRALLARIRRELTAAGYDCRAAAAATPGAAVLLARTGASHAVASPRRLQGALHGIALALSELPANTIAAFAGIGAHTIGAVLRLPRAELGRRFGQATVDYLDRVLGMRADPVERFIAPERFHAEIELASPVHSTEALLFGAARLLRELGDWLQARQLAVQRYTLGLRHEGRASTQIQIGLRLASTAHEHLLALLRARLENLRLPDAVHALVLEAPECSPLRGANADLFERAAQADEDAERLLERLRSRLGEASVRQVQLHADHRPEFAEEEIKGSEPFSRSQNTESTRPFPREKGSDPFISSSRPLYLLDPPQPLEQWHEIDLEALTLCGPERIESGWWDAAGVRRDYFRAQAPDGTTYWLYCEWKRKGSEPFSRGKANADSVSSEREKGSDPFLFSWFVHGIFA